MCVWLVGSVVLLGLATLLHARTAGRKPTPEEQRPPVPRTPASYDVAKPGLPDRRQQDGPRDVSSRPLHRMVH